MRSHSSRRRLVNLALGAALVLFVSGAALRAHELGTTRVSVLFDERRTYSIENVTDAAGLVEKLDAVSGQLPRTDLGPDRLQSVLAGFDATFRRRVKLAFDT